MIVKDAESATEQARRIIGNPVRFLPRKAKKVGGRWVVEATIGLLDDIFVTVDMPERLLDV